uniref:HTH lysR-type domain-containing protein n=1 Tax=uncultured Thiotrichaceae bacterium TaxID=298394 RepID=A0A6S6TUH1_9GAMM|nr:MAG: Unknown protein [uncultured Thiotrichaceae bacterium]
MKHHLPPLDTLKAFEAAGRHLSFSLAADELCITKSAVSYQIRKLEEQVQSTLFKRSVRQVYLTDSGQRLFQTTQQLFKELETTLFRLRDDNQQAAVSVAATTYVAARWLSPRIAHFSELHPDIAIQFLHTVNSADFKLGDVDLAVRWCRCSDRKERNRLRDIPMPLFPVASPGLLKRIGIVVDTLPLSSTQLQQPAQQAQFSQLPLLAEERPQDLWQDWLAYSGLSNTNPHRIISDADESGQAALVGEGVILACVRK